MYRITIYRKTSDGIQYVFCAFDVSGTYEVALAECKRQMKTNVRNVLGIIAYGNQILETISQTISFEVVQ
jgi:hypothetical protein